MNENLSEVEIFAKTLKLRNLFKDLNQLTWSIREAEQKFSVQTNAKDLLTLYEEFSNQLLELTKKVEEANGK